MSQSDDFVTKFRSCSAEAIALLNKLTELNQEAALLGYPANLVEAFTGDNSNQTAQTVTVGLAVYAEVTAALQANNNAGMTAIYQGPA